MKLLLYKLANEKIERILLFSMAIFLLLGCSNGGEVGVENEKNYAPESVRLKSLAFYNRLDHWSFKLVQGDRDIPTVVIVNSTDYVIDNTDASYVKTSDNTADVNVYFNANTLIGGNKVGTHYEYYLKLTFKTPHQGVYTGVCKSGGIGELKSENVSGYFVFDSDELPNPDAGNGKEEIDYSKLTGAWENRINETSVKQFFFNEDGTYIQKMSFNNEKGEATGIYKINKTDNTLELYERGVSMPTSTLLVTSLTNDNLEIRVYDPIIGDYNDPEYYSRITGAEAENVTFSACTVSNITKSSVTISGVISKGNGVVFQETGICYSSKSSAWPTIENDYKQKTSSGDINCILEGLTEGLRYTVRLYAVTAKKTYYGEITAFETASEIKLKVINVSPTTILLESTSTGKYNKFGICAGKYPHPTVTDISLEEATGKTSWNLTDLNKATNYYIRAYQVNGSKIKYDEESEISIATVGKDIQIQCSSNGRPYRDGWETDYYPFKVEYALPKGTYKLALNTYGGQFDNNHIPWVNKNMGFVEGSNSVTYNGYVSFGSKAFFEAKLECIESGIIYYSNVIAGSMLGWDVWE